MIWLIYILLLLPVKENQQKVIGETTRPVGVWVVEVSKDGKYIALGGDDSTLWVYQVTDYSVYRSFKLNSAIRGLSWNSKENILAVSTMSGLHLLDMKTEQIQNLPHIRSGGRGVGWNFTGDLLALASDGVVYVMDKKGKLIRSIPKHNNHSYFSLDWHPSKNVMVTSSDEILLFDTSGKQLQFIKHRKENTGVLSVRWHPSGQFFASGDYGHENEGTPTILQFWKEDGTLLLTLPGHHAEIRNLTWNSDGSLLATASDVLRIWNKDGKLLYTGKSKTNLWGVAWTKDNQYLVTGSFDNGEVRLWNRKAELIKVIN